MKELLQNDLPQVLGSYFDDPEKVVVHREFQPGVLHLEVDGKAYVLKKYPQEFAPERLRFFEELQNFTNGSLRIPPRVIPTHDQSLHVHVDGFGYDLTDYVHSHDFNSSKIPDPKLFFGHIGSFVGELHTTFGEFEQSGRPTISSLLSICPECPDHIETLLKEYQRAGIEKPWIRILEDKIALAKDYLSTDNPLGQLPQKVVHGDLYLKNILLNADQKVVGLIDFAQAGTFFRCYEAMRALIQTNRFFNKIALNPVYLTSYLQAYLGNCCLDEAELKNLVDFYIFTQASDISFLDVDTLQSDDEGKKAYARYRFDSLMSLHDNRQQLNKSIDDLMRSTDLYGKRT